MAKLDELLADAEKTHRDMQDALQRSDDKAVRDIVGLRTRFAVHMADMIGAVRDDERLKTNPELAREFEARFLEIRQKLAQHQAKYRAATIEEDKAGYRASVAEMARLQEGFYSWAKTALS